MDYREITRAHKENIGSGCTPFCIERVGPAVSDSLHIHDFHQLTVVTRGNATLVLNGASYPIRAGDVYVVSSFSAHYLKDTRDLEFVNLLFYLRDLEPYAGTISQTEGYKTLLLLQPVLEGHARPSNIFSLDYEEIDYVNRVLTQLLDEQEENRPGRELMIQAGFLSLMVYLCRVYRPDKQRRRTPYSYQLGKAVRHMEENCAEPMTLEDLTGLCGMTERQLRQLFSQEYDCTPLQFLWNVRIRKACYYLASTDLPISEVAAQSGFEDNNYFSRKFRQVLGVTPRDYRNQSRGGE